MMMDGHCLEWLPRLIAPRLRQMSGVLEPHARTIAAFATCPLFVSHVQRRTKPWKNLRVVAFGGEL